MIEVGVSIACVLALVVSVLSVGLLIQQMGGQSRPAPTARRDRRGLPLGGAGSLLAVPLLNRLVVIDAEPGRNRVDPRRAANVSQPGRSQATFIFPQASRQSTTVGSR